MSTWPAVMPGLGSRRVASERHDCGTDAPVDVSIQVGATRVEMLGGKTA